MKCCTGSSSTWRISTRVSAESTLAAGVGCAPEAAANSSPEADRCSRAWSARSYSRAVGLAAESLPSAKFETPRSAVRPRALTPLIITAD
eukprot:scaffold101599_cov35-Prasinocladus_malaysianus.AAC.1